jgi:hypothetical protein
VKRALRVAALAGLGSGLVVLGAGGRLLMRALTVTLEEGPRFTWTGTLAVLGGGAAWGLLTGPLLVPIRARVGPGRSVGTALGLVSCALAGAALATISGVEVDAPPLFLLLSAVSFPALFVLFGLAVERLAARWDARPTSPGR